MSADEPELMRPTPIEDLPPEVATLAKQAQSFRATNQRLIGEMEAMGATFDLAQPHIEHTLTALVKFGVITEEQMWTMHRDWELNLRGQLKSARDQLRAAHQAAVARRKLILPGDPRMS